MIDAEHARRIVSLEARMSRLEAMMQQLLGILTSSNAERDRLVHMQALLQELHNSPDIQARSMPPSMPGAYPQQQERPEMQAIRAAMLAGDKVKAIQLYRSAYGVGLKEAQAALDRL